MDYIYFTVVKINGDYAELISDDGLENTVALALLPDDIREQSRLSWINFEFTLM